MIETPTLDYKVRKNRSDGYFYATLIRGKRPTDKSKHGPFLSRQAAKEAMNQEITSYLANLIEGELMADFMSTEIEKASNKCAQTVCFNKSHPDARLPIFSTDDAVGADLFAVVSGEDDVIEPGQRKLIKTGLTIANMDKDYELQVRPRSGLALKHGITVLNSPGTVDPDYRGEIGVILLNTSDTPFVVRTGDRIAQLVPSKRHPMFFVFDANTTNTRRGSGGFGSTGH